MATQVTMATPAQVKYLHGLYRAANWDSEQYHFVLDNDYGVESTTALTLSQAHEMITLLKSIVMGEDYDRATLKQIALIRSQWLAIDYSKGANGDVHLNAFIQKKFKKAKLEFMTKHEAVKMLNMIKAMTKQAKEREGKTTVIKKLASCVYCYTPIMWVQLQGGERVAFDVVKKPGRDYEATNFHNCRGKK